MKKLLLVFFALPMLATAQIAHWNCSGASEVATLDATVFNTNLDSSPTLTRGSGAPASAGANSFRTTGFQNNGIAVTNTDYFQHELSAASGYSLSMDSIKVTVTGTASYAVAPGVNMDYAYSFDGTNFTLVNSGANVIGTNQTFVVNLGGISALQNVDAATTITFRFYATGQSSTGGWGYFQEGARFYGKLIPVAGCNISSADLTVLTCNDNNTDSDPVDDYISFSLNPTGSDLGATYSVSVSSGTITPTTGTYGSATSFRLQDGSAGAGDVVVTITDADESACTLDVTINDPGTCSSTIPLITVTPSSLTGFNHMVGTPSASQTFDVSGIALTDDITVTASTGFEISLDNIAYGATVSLTPASGTVTATTVYVRGNSSVYGSFSGNVVASSTGADNDTVTVAGFANDYVYYTIDQINGVDGNGVADSLGVLVTVTGVLHCMDFRAGNGYNLTIIDASGKGIYVFSNSDLNGYSNPVAGDSIRVRGQIAQFNGLLQVVPVQINLLSSGVPTNAPIVVSTLNESTENQYITLENVTLVNPIATFPAANTNLDVTDGTSTFQIRILTSTNLGGTPAPQGPFNVTGIGSQFDSSNPYTSGYQLLPCGTDAIEIVCAGANLPDVTVNTTMEGNLSAAATGVTYQWINCADNSPVIGETDQDFTASVFGQYAVIIDNGTCVDTSACFTSGNVSIDNIELASQIVAYPNPVNDQLTIKNYSGAEVVFTITDINGKIVLENTTADIITLVNTESWNRGVYFVRFSGKNNESHILKVVK